MNRVSQAVTFLSWLFEPYPDGFVEIRCLNQGRNQMRFYELPRSLDDWTGIGEACVQWSDEGNDVYVGVLPRWRKGGRDNDVQRATGRSFCIFCNGTLGRIARTERRDAECIPFLNPTPNMHEKFLVYFDVWLQPRLPVVILV